MFPLSEISITKPGVTQMTMCGFEVMQSVYKPNLAIDEISASN